MESYEAREAGALQKPRRARQPRLSVEKAKGKNRSSGAPAALPLSAMDLIAFAGIVPYPQLMDLLTHDELARLTPQERLALISLLWDSLEDNQFPLTAAQQAELDSRLTLLDQERHEGITWADLKAELERRCP